MTRGAQLKAYIQSLKGADQKNDEVFHKIVEQGMDIMQLLDSDLAHEFNVSRPTVNRWRSGANAPHPALRKHVFAWLHKRAATLHARELVEA